VASGARLLAGGKANPSHGSKAFLTPTLLVDVTSSMKIAQKEVWLALMWFVAFADTYDIEYRRCSGP
jgi:acyl-CoA reductase-like NAD-dependent aldehyde dehydrogenase